MESGRFTSGNQIFVWRKSHDSRVCERVTDLMKEWGTGPNGWGPKVSWVFAPCLARESANSLPGGGIVCFDPAYYYGGKEGGGIE